MNMQEASSGRAATSPEAGPWVGEAVQEADLSAVRPLPGAPAGGGAAARDIAGSGFTYRHDWGNRRGGHRLLLNLGGVTPRSRVFVSIAEGAAGGPDAGKFVGNAKFTLSNVAPRAGGVDIWVDIGWDSDIRIYVDYLVINP